MTGQEGTQAMGGEGSAPGTRAGRRVEVTGDLYHGQVPEGAIYCGRAAPGLPASPYANPHTVAKQRRTACRACGARHRGPAEAVRAYAEDLAARPQLVERARRELVGQDLACWCWVGSLCHVDLLRLVVDGEEPLAAWWELDGRAPAGGQPATLW